MTKPGRRLLALSIGLAIGLVAAWAVQRGRTPPDIGVVDQTASVEEVLLERQLAPRGLGPFDLRPGLAHLAREPLDEATVARIAPLNSFLQWDPIQYFRYRPHLDETIPFPQYPGGAYHRRTNGDGYREDHETPRPGSGLLVIATGDSHTDGIGENADSWTTRLEQALSASRPGTAVEVLNTGVQNYSFYHYLAALERALPLDPDAVVTLCYGGNDFVEVLLLHHLFQHTVRPVQRREHWDALRRADGVHEPELTQILYSASYFERFPDQADRALEAAAAVCAEIQRTCEARGIPWVFAYLPSAYSLPWKELAAERARDLAAVELTESALTRIDGLADRLLAILRQRGVTVVDLRVPLGAMARAGEARPYWDEFHVDVRGQALVAHWLAEPVEAALSSRTRKVPR